MSEELVDALPVTAIAVLCANRANTDTGGEFIFVGCQSANKLGFQAPAEHELC